MPQNQEIPQVQIGALAFGAFVHQLPEIAKQLKIANKLKALELKSAGRYSITPEMVYDIMKGE